MVQGNPLLLDNVPARVWRAFQEGGGEGEQQAEPVHLACWDRARRLGADPRGIPMEAHLLRGEALRSRVERLEQLQALGVSAIERAARLVSEHEFILLLADPDSVVLRTQGGGQFGREAERLLLMAGATWSEAARGTNAIGTAAVERRPTIVLGRGHFSQSNHRLACYAAPIFDAHGEVVAVLDATSHLAQATAEVGESVFACAQTLSGLLRLEAYAGAGGSVLRVLGGCLDRERAAGLLVEAPGRVVHLNDAARLEVGAELGGDTCALLGLDWPALVRAAYDAPRSGRPVRSPRGTEFRLHAEPILGRDRRPLSIVVRLEPRRTRTSAPSEPPKPSRGRRRTGAFREIFSQDEALDRAIDWADVLAQSELPVMLLAETGAGKELFARAIHAASPRTEGPFVAINCGAVAPSLLESELFGYAPSAFTGADRRGRPGLFHAADGGTLFLDEVAEMPLSMQAALLRVLDAGTFHRVGDSRPQNTQVRVICATCRDLERAVDEGSFRSDLYFRLKGAALRLPPLRERSDLLALARHLVSVRAARSQWARVPSFSVECEQRLLRHPWRGNVRELAATLDVALVSALALGAAEIDEAHLPEDVGASPGPPTHAREVGALQRAEAEAVTRVLVRHAGNISASARELGVARSTLYRLVRRLGIATSDPGLS